MTNPIQKALAKAEAIIAQDRELDAVLNAPKPAAKIPNWSELTPSYGRDYPTGEAAKEDFLAGKDFTLAATGQQTSIADVAPGTTVILRFKRLTGTATVKPTAAQIAGLNR